ncbi:putative coxi translation protein cya5 [Diaporthe ampelina]|uniref:Putative coxi translation protein cya5 n=1 Tax=Diaporthe ampelina TaxID=1214573 RepID=A0A0G2HUL8_9PEZI|nr:putative coxi translation protein cya5 [Diaporthe ampelina]
MEQLLATAIKFSKWETFGDVWERYPDAHRTDAEELNWEHFESVLSMEEIANGIKALVFRIDTASRSIVRQDPEFSHSLLNRVITPCIRRYWRELKGDDLALVLHLLKDHLLYEDLICRSKELGPSLTIKLYRQYRKLKGVKLRGHVMREMMQKVFFPADDAAGMEMMVKDWHTRFNELDIPSYRLYMTFHARRGDAIAVQRLWDAYTKDWPNRNSAVGSKNPEYLPLLHVQAVRGELSEVRRVFNTLQNDYGTDLPVICWNVLLNAHAKAGEYDTAIRVFTVLQDTCKPDKYSYGTMMGLSGSRGDLEFTLELYRMAKNDGIEPNTAMVDCVVEAYSQNDRHVDAESICVMTTKARRFKPEDCTVLWNTLLYHQASRRDLAAVNRLLVAMTEHNIPYDNETYDHLLRGLALCRQPHHALYLLTSAVKNHSFKPTLRHYALLMSAFLRSGQSMQALQSSTILQDLGMPKSNEAMVRVFKALGGVAQRSPDEDNSKQQSLLASALRQFRKAMKPAQRPKRAQQLGHTWIRTLNFPDTVANRTDLASVLIFVFAQMRQTVAVPEILRLWRKSSPEAANMQEPPLRLLEALMLSAFHDGNYDEVKDLWRMILDRAVHMSHVGAPGTTRDEPLPSMRYILSNPLKTVQRMYAAQGDADGLRQVISSVLQSRFRLDSKNWNYYVQFLASMKKFREAFIVCEEQLMPHWLGWQRVRRVVSEAKTALPLDLRRKGSSPRANRPITHTLLTLTKAYMDLEQMAAWSPDADRLLSYIVDKCPGVMAAVKTLVRTSDETERKHFLSEKQAKLEEDMRRDQLQREQTGDVADEEMPQAFLDMMELAGAGQGNSVKQGSWGEDSDEAVADARSDDEDSQWSDVNDADSDDWTPRGSSFSRGSQTLGSAAGDSLSQDLRKVEDAIFTTKKPAIFTSAEAKSPRPSTPRGSKPGGKKER